MGADDKLQKVIDYLNIESSINVDQDRWMHSMSKRMDDMEKDLDLYKKLVRNR